MGSRKSKNIPQRTRKPDAQRADYFKTLGRRPVSETTQTLSTETEQNELSSMGGTAYTIPKEDTAKAAPEYQKIQPKEFGLWSFVKEHNGVVAGIIVIIIFIATIVTAYNNFTNKIDNANRDLDNYKSSNDEHVKKLEKDLKDEMRYIIDRIDKYISKKP